VKLHLPILDAFEQAAVDGLLEHGRAIEERSNELSPTDTGETDKTSFVAVEDLTVQVGYTSFIARLQHENLDNQHKPGEQAKFLETAVDELAGDLEATLAKHVQGVLGG